MIRKIIEIDEQLCNGCGLCVKACHEGAIGLVGGKAKLLKDDYCDGLGNCLPVCPTGAITFVEREAAAFDEEAVKASMAKAAPAPALLACGCPGTNAKKLERRPAEPAPSAEKTPEDSQLNQWPVQLKLVPVNAAYFDGAHLLIAADCAAYAHGSFHNRFMRGRITLIGCPKLDSGDYTEKLTAILSQNNIKSVTVVRMEVPCCAGIAHAAVEALRGCGKMIPWSVETLSTDGKILQTS